MKSLIADISRDRMEQAVGRISEVNELSIKLAGPLTHLAMGARPVTETGVPLEVTAVEDGSATCLSFASLKGVKVGTHVLFSDQSGEIMPGPSWLGRVLNGLAKPIDNKGALPKGPRHISVHGSPPPAHERAGLGAHMSLGIRVFDTFLPCCKGQRLGIFAGSGVGKSMLMSMLARQSEADVNVIGLIGERGREVQEFIANTLGPEGLAKSIIVVATSDEPALMRREAAYLTLAIAESFRDLGSNVLCLMDNLTRFAQAQREIGLASGEPPTTRGLTPSVFSELPRLLERAGPGISGTGTITGFFAVLVEGDNHNEPISDAVRGILDGHIVLSREIAERGRYPAIDLLASVSRSFQHALPLERQEIVKAARRELATFRDMEELIRLGAYRRGSNPEVDHAMQIVPGIETFLNQSEDDGSSIDDSFARLSEILDARSSEVADDQPTDVGL